MYVWGTDEAKNVLRGDESADGGVADAEDKSCIVLRGSYC